MYYGYAPRIYILTKKETDIGKAFCPKCGKTLRLLPFTRTDKLYKCNCGFIIQKSCVIAEKDSFASDIFDLLEDNSINSDNTEEVTMDIKQELTKIAKTVSASNVSKQQAMDYLLACGVNPMDLRPLTHDYLRIESMNIKSKRNDGKFIQFAKNMANSIDSAEKAFRRGVAVLDKDYLSTVGKTAEAASVFFERAVHLAGNV